MPHTLSEALPAAVELDGEADERTGPAAEQFLAQQTEETFVGLVRAFSPRLLRYFRFRGCPDSLAEELSQDVLFTVYRQVHTLREKAMFRAWLYKVAQNTLLQHRRKVMRRVMTVQVEEVDEQVFGHDANCLGEARGHGQFAEWMQWLEELERKVMTLRYVEDLEYHEIASVLEIPIGTVKWRLFRAKEKLISRFEERT